MGQSPPDPDHCIDRCGSHVRLAGLLLIVSPSSCRDMSKAILTSSQYQNHRFIDLIVVHCSATRCNGSISVDVIDAWHRAMGFARIGYHYYITRDGDVHTGRPLYQVGAHASGYNEHSIGVCYEGGLDEEGNCCDTRTPEQKESLLRLLQRLKTDYPAATLVGHRDLPGVRKACPCFDVEIEYRGIMLKNENKEVNFR